MFTKKGAINLHCILICRICALQILLVFLFVPWKSIYENNRLRKCPVKKKVPVVSALRNGDRELLRPCCH